jgi:hypothetical protein
MTASEDFSNRYVTRAALAEALQCSQRTIARLEKQPNGLPSILVGGRRFYILENVHKWLASLERHPNPSPERREPVEAA